MKLESSKKTIDKSAKEVFDFLNDVKNIEKLMPENTSKFEMVGNDGFVFALTGMPEVAMKKIDSHSPDTLVLGSGGGKLEFKLNIHINGITENTSEAHMVFTGDFNAMIGMMVKGPISKLIDTWVTKLPKAI